MADLAKYREVKHIHDHSEVVSRMLAVGWELISAKIVESQHPVWTAPPTVERIIEKRGEAHYIIGLPRDHKTPKQRREAEKMRDVMDR